MKRRHILTLPIILVIQLCMMMQSCRNDSAPSPESVPADADFIAIADLSEWKSDDGTVPVLPTAGFNSIFDNISEYTDLSSVICYKPASARGAITAVTVTDRDNLTRTLTQSGWRRQETDGIGIYVPEDNNGFSPCLIISGDGAWLLSSKSDVKIWEKSMEQAEKENFTSLGLPCELTGGQSLLAYVNPACMGMPSSGAMIKIADSADKTTGSTLLTATMVSTGGSGATTEISALTEIDLSPDGFSRYIPSGPCLTLAAGIKKGINWSGLVEMSGTGIGMRNQGMLQSLLPYMNSLDGTFALSIGPLTPENILSDDIEQQQLLLYASLEGNRATDAVNEINTNLRLKGLNPQPRADGIYALSMNGTTYRYTARGNVFLFALNREIDIASPAPADIHPGTLASASLTLPTVDGLSPSAQITVDSKKCVLRMTGTPVATAFGLLSKYFTNINNARHALRVSAPDYYDDYN